MHRIVILLFKQPRELRSILGSGPLASWNGTTASRIWHLSSRLRRKTFFVRATPPQTSNRVKTGGLTRPPLVRFPSLALVSSRLGTTTALTPTLTPTPTKTDLPPVTASVPAVHLLPRIPVLAPVLSPPTRYPRHPATPTAPARSAPMQLPSACPCDPLRPVARCLQLRLGKRRPMTCEGRTAGKPPSAYRPIPATVSKALYEGLSLVN